MQIVAASNHRVRLDRIWISGQGTSNVEVPTQFRVAKMTTAGTSSANNPVKRNPSDDETLEVTGLKTFTAEPTITDIYAARAIHPQSGYEFVFPPGRELWIPGGARVGLYVISPAQANNWIISAEGEE
jgi:hypothetical protein